MNVSGHLRWGDVQPLWDFNQDNLVVKIKYLRAATFSCVGHKLQNEMQLCDDERHSP